MPTVSVIIPVKNSLDTLRTCLESLSQQTYTDFETIIVADKNDSSINTVRDDYFDARVIEVISSNNGERDSNFKRNIGIENAEGEILAFTDADIILPSNWLAEIVNNLNGFDIVGGPMCGIDDGFINSYYDLTMMPKCPHYTKRSIINKRNFGILNKVMATANLGVKMEVIRKVGTFNEDFRDSYEDYEFLWRVVKNDIKLLALPHLIVQHKHYRSLAKTFEHFFRSGVGCAQFMITHTSSPLALKRFVQLVGLLSLPFLVFTFPPILLVLLTGLIAYSSVLFFRLRKLKAPFFPILDFLMGVTFTSGMIRGLIKFTKKNIFKATRHFT